VTKVVRITKTVAENRLGNVPQGKEFWCRDGQVLKSLPQLGVALKQMDEETFRHHSSESRNDFSNWVRDVIGDEKLSRDLLKSATQAQAAKSIEYRIAWLKSKIEA
jgi:hypothetical protein